ncbi:Trp biosynthesis-associated membrane protein [Nonomuraea fuscirosea]|uniref:Trp biosynthesis-associated membrane protein n=1 Tax=Nonomuraea fuscirosea TaxID=1291556 RepID=UPI002DD7C7BC|nr:Trp biosynthesis-associated membrane protein [Nonomuraea fuscirosea]WSA47917.1 Trp biosynthesis-associated membrane protein [Nonomuraea fuscirosea]
MRADKSDGADRADGAGRVGEADEVGGVGGADGVGGAVEGGGAAVRRGELWGWVVATALGSLLVLVAAGQTWARVLGNGDTAAPTGGDLSPVLTPAALAGLAGVVAVLAAKGLGRRVVGVLLALCGVATAAGTWTALDDAGVTGWLRERNVLHGVTDLPWEPVTWWPVVSGAGAVLMIAGGAVAVVRASAWSGMSARYDRERRPPAGAETQVADDRALWDALDRGDDPTDSR